MKILMVNKFLYPKGGSETYMFMLADYLKSKGHEVSYFGMYDDRNIVDSNTSLHVGNMDFHSKSIGRLLYPLKVIYSSEARVKIRNMIQSVRPDIVHINNFNYQLTPSILYEIKNLKVPAVQTMHDPNLVCPSHTLYNYQKQQVCEKCKGNRFFMCALTKCMDGKLSKSLLGTVESYLYHFLGVYKTIKYFICPSNFIKEKFVEFGADKNRMRVLHNFIIPQGQISYDKKDYVLYFGRLSQEKGLHSLIEAAKTLPHIRFVFAGTGPMEKEPGRYDNIEYAGFKKGEDLKKLIGESLFTIYPSNWYENCPMSILESHSLGTPVIGAKIGGIPELIQDGVDGLLFKAGDSADLAEKIASLYENRKLILEMSQNSITESGKFSIEEYYKRIMNIYEDAIKGQTL